MSYLHGQSEIGGIGKSGQVANGSDRGLAAEEGLSGLFGYLLASSDHGGL